MVAISAVEERVSFYMGGFTWTAEYSETGLRELNFIEGKGRVTDTEDLQYPERLKKLQNAIAARVSGKALDLEWKDFDLSGRAGFHLRIWKKMHAIPFGQTRSYAEVARAAGSPLAFRACGQACAANPILLFIPCHRVVGAAGLGGFSRGLSWKKRFLAWEGVIIDD